MTTRVSLEEAPIVCSRSAENDAGARRREAILLAAILLIALALRLWGLDQNRWGAEYYTAAVRSMAMNWHNFFNNNFL